MNAWIEQAAINLGMATFTSANIGFERQWRQPMAGLRTNTLVVIVAGLSFSKACFPQKDSRARVAAGIGFLGAGIMLVTGFVILFNLTLRSLIRIINGSCSRRPKLTSTIACGSCAAIRKRRMPAPCCCRASVKAG